MAHGGRTRRRKNAPKSHMMAVVAADGVDLYEGSATLEEKTCEGNHCTYPDRVMTCIGSPEGGVRRGGLRFLIFWTFW